MGDNKPKKYKFNEEINMNLTFKKISAFDERNIIPTIG